jgi:hypothetical protein
MPSGQWSFIQVKRVVSAVWDEQPEAGSRYLGSNFEIVFHRKKSNLVKIK